LVADKYDEILEVESKYRHLDTFSTDIYEDAYVLYAFGHTIRADSKDEACLNRAIHYYERAKERMEEANAYDQSQSWEDIKVTNWDESCHFVYSRS